MQPLALDAHLPRLLASLRGQPNLVLAAAPGSGKTTRVAPALLDAPWLRGRVLLLQPRRLAARAAAQRIAEERGWRVGGRVGFQVRFERRVSEETELEVITEGLLTRRLQADPFLSGVGAVILDEFHERSVHVDLGLALLREVQRAREELRIVVMSATLESQPVAMFLGGCPALALESSLHPVEIVYSKSSSRADSAAIARATVRALLERPAGDVLVFLPGVGEIRRVRERLGAESALAGVDLVPLYGGLSGAEQDRALRAGQRRRVVLSTNVAETSVTVQGVSTVVDSGMARLPRFDPRSGMDRLELVPISMASAAQRAGRAGRLGPGRVYRLWTEAEQASRPKETPAEIRRIDLAGVVLELRAWGTDPGSFQWFEAPPAGALASAEALLVRLGALDTTTRAITELGRAIVALPLHPRLGRLLLAAATAGCLREGAAIAALLSERDLLSVRATHGASAPDLPSGNSDVLMRLELLGLAEREGFRHGAGLFAEIDLHAARAVARARDDLLAQLAPRLRHGLEPRARAAAEETLLRLLLAAYPDRVVRRRDAAGPRGVMVGGRGVVLDRQSIVREARFFVAPLLDGRGPDATVRLASAIDPSWLNSRAEDHCSFDPASGRVIATRRVLFEDLVLDEQPRSPHAEEAATRLAEHASRDPLAALEPDEPTLSFLARVRWLAGQMPELELPADEAIWVRGLLPTLCAGKSKLAELRAEPLRRWLEGSLTAAQRRSLERLAPERLRVPSGRQVTLTYPEQGPPVLSVKLQELFGLADTPTVAGGATPVLLELLAPNGRPVQRTRDLRSFWDRTYAEVRKELRQRYPRHPWPEDPWSEAPTARARPRTRR